MKLFDIFKKQKKMSIKELCTPVLDVMWACVINFRPWEADNHGVAFKKVKIVKAQVNEGGIWVDSSETNPFDVDSNLSGYIDKITARFCGWVGFFETREEAEKAYTNLMLDWIEVIKSKLGETKQTEDGEAGEVV